MQQKLNTTAINQYINSTSLSWLTELVILDSIDSTNRYVLEHPTAKSGFACLAEQQTAGRGRRGKSWVSPAGANIYFSLLWHFPQDMTNLSSLSIATGVAVIQALQAYGIHDVQLKWPNDIVYTAPSGTLQKLGGILIETIANPNGPWRMAVGIGLNVAMPTVPETTIQQPWTDIATITRKPADRNIIAGLLLQQVLLMLPRFQDEGLKPFCNMWHEVDILRNRAITITTPSAILEGLALGIADDGGLRVQLDDKIQIFHSGEVSVRLNDITHRHRQ